MGGDEDLSLPLFGFCLRTQLRAPLSTRKSLLQCLMGVMAVEPLNFTRPAHLLVPNETKEPQPFSPLAFNFLPLHRLLAFFDLGKK